MQARIATILAALATGCAGVAPDLAPEAADSASQSAPPSTHLLSLFVWEHRAPECAADEACTQRIEMVGAGATTANNRGRLSSFRPASEDYERLARAVTDERLLAALRDPTTCARGATDTAATAEPAPADAIAVGVDGEPATRGTLAGCAGEPFDAVRTAVDELWARYVRDAAATTTTTATATP